MKKTAYIAPKMEVCVIHGQELLNTISNPSKTNVDGLGVTDTEYTGEGRVKDQGGYNVWDDDWSR